MKIRLMPVFYADANTSETGLRVTFDMSVVPKLFSELPDFKMMMNLEVEEFEEWDSSDEIVRESGRHAIRECIVENCGPDVATAAVVMTPDDTTLSVGVIREDAWEFYDFDGEFRDAVNDNLSWD